MRTLITYEGSKRPSHEIAVITAENTGVIISGIDNYIKKKPFYIKEDSIEVLPGSHRVEVNYYRHTIAQRKSSRTSVLLEFKAQAGHHYGIKADAGMRYWHAWIMDMDDSVIVADKQEGFLH